MANDKDQAADKNMNDNQEPMVETNNNNHHEEEDDDDFLKLTLFTRARPDPPTSTLQPDLYLSSMYGLLQDHTSQLHMSSLTSMYPFFQPQNPNPNPDFNPLVQNPSSEQLLPTENPKPNTKRSSYGPIQSARPLAVRKRRNAANRGLRSGKSQTVQPPYPWATNRRATVHNLEKLGSLGIETVVGEVQCRRCEKTFEVGYDLRAEFSKLRSFIEERKDTLKDRSAPEWDTPACLDCKHCHEKVSAKAIVAEKKRNINWLFLLLGGFLCNCTLEQLKYMMV